MNKRPIGFHQHDERFEEMRSRHDRTAGLIVKGAGVFGIVWVLWACVCLAGVAGLGYVAWHFIAKFW